MVNLLSDFRPTFWAKNIQNSILKRAFESDDTAVVTCNFKKRMVKLFFRKG